MLDSALRQVVREKVVELKQVREERIANTEHAMLRMVLKNVLHDLVVMADPDPVAPTRRFVNETELASLNSLMDYISVSGKISRPRVQRDVQRTFGIAAVEDLPGCQFPDALLFLKEWLI